MFFLLRVCFLLALTVIPTLAKAYKLNCSSVGSASIETPSETNEGLNITETWTWLPGFVNSSETENETMFWDKMFPVKERSNDEQGTNWCMHVATSFEKMNFSRFEVRFLKYSIVCVQIYPLFCL
jgi:hypothetical protein